MIIREAKAEDWATIWLFFHQIVKAQETFAFEPDLNEEDARALWMVKPPGLTVVAMSDDGQFILGSASMYPNRSGPGAHVSSASFMVDEQHSGKGVGRALVEYALNWAKSQGFSAMQFNAVVESNVYAIRLYENLGFKIVGTVPDAFRHPREGLVSLHIMHRVL
ncbi:GNAT family N-acetyltransferase [Bacillus horti]|uniref:L-amino acid N-acyltransferase YncA n=1 Tax=Caldalkalibacillus horti TaxID=77523 RepID=A0ABT9VYA5_9BACI|nr:GNAT family N-acetyltransferase [Bacillus horti]MDQ0165983.1 L-amino acid N-acyltransferase YncA [Bacillus horti]